MSPLLQNPFLSALRVLLLVLLLSSLSAAQSTTSTSSMVMQWVQQASLPADGRHHPITFANETHGFVIGGTTASTIAMPDAFVWHEATNTWTDISAPLSSFPPRSFGYGVVLPVKRSTKAYLGFGMSAIGEPLNDLWELDMTTLAVRQLSSCPGVGRRHPAMNAVQRSDQDDWEIHIGLGDTISQNLNDWWIYNIQNDQWTQQPDLPAIPRHHPFYFAIDGDSYAGLGHSATGIERDWFRLNHQQNGGVKEWIAESDFASYQLSVQNNSTTTDGTLVTAEARVAGTQFSIVRPTISTYIGDDGTASVQQQTTTTNSNKSFGFVLSGDGDDHFTMPTGEFHGFDPVTQKWYALPPHPGPSRWAPGSFVIRGTARAYFLGGLDRSGQILWNDMWGIDLSPLFYMTTSSTTTTTTTDGTVGTGTGEENDSGSTSSTTTTTTTTTTNTAGDNNESTEGGLQPEVSPVADATSSGSRPSRMDWRLLWGSSSSSLHTALTLSLFGALLL